MNKKAEGTGASTVESYFMGFVLMFFILIFGTALVYITSLHKVDILTPEEEMELLLVREAARNCFLNIEEGRVHYDMINPDLISDEKLTICLPNIGIKVRLINPAGDVIKSAESIEYSGKLREEYNVNVLGSDEIHKLVVIS